MNKYINPELKKNGNLVRCGRCGLIVVVGWLVGCWGRQSLPAAYHQILDF